MIWLSKEQVLYLHSELIQATGGLDGLRDDNLLQSALLSPMQTYDDTELFPTLIDKAVRLASSVIEISISSVKYCAACCSLEKNRLFSKLSHKN